MHKTAVVILNWNGIEFLKKFLPDIIRYSMDEETSVYVADNGSTDGSKEWLRENRNVGVIGLDMNYGFAGGYNLALSNIDAEYLVILNSDIEVSEGWLRPLIRCMDENKDVASCQPKIRSYYKRDHFEYAGAAGGFIDRFGYTFCRGRIFGNVEKDYGQYDTPCDIFWSTGACMVVRRDAWERCKGFDKDFFAHMEEVDLCWRFQRAGYRIRYVPESTVYHVGGGSLSYQSPFKTYLNFRNNLFILYKNLPEEKLSKTMFIRKLLDGIAAAMFLLTGKFRNAVAVLKAHIDYYKAAELLREKRVSFGPVLDNPAGIVLNKSIVFEFYLKRKRTFNSLKFQTTEK